MDRYILIDPTGINLACEVVGEPIVLDPSTLNYSSSTVSGGSITGASEARYNFTFVTRLSEAQTRAIEALSRNQETTGRVAEIVAYYVFDKHSDLGSTPTREPLPGVALEVDSDLNTVSYFPVIQGDIVVSKALVGLGPDNTPRYNVQINFIEGTIRRPQP